MSLLICRPPRGYNFAEGQPWWSTAMSSNGLALRAGSVLLLHHQRPHHPRLGDRVPGQRPLRPGEPDRPVEGRGEGAGDAGGRPGEQLGLYGDGLSGVEPEGVVGVAGAGASPVGGEASCGEGVAATDGVLDILRGADPGAVPDRQGSRSDRLSPAVLESVAGGVPAVGGAAAVVAVVSGSASPKPESGCSGPCGLRTDERR